MVDEAERSLHDALSVLSQTVKETRTVLGGGCSEMLMSCAVDDAAHSVEGKKAIAVESFARALRQIPTILADNAGYDSSDLVTRLRAAHYNGQADAGLGKCYRLEKLCNAAQLLAPLRYGQCYHRVDEKARRHRELQAQAPGGPQCNRSSGDDHSVSYRNMILDIGLILFSNLQCRRHSKGSTPETRSCLG